MHLGDRVYPRIHFDYVAAQAMFDLMRTYGDGKLIKSKTELDEGAFSRPTNSANHAILRHHITSYSADRLGIIERTSPN